MIKGAVIFTIVLWGLIGFLELRRYHNSRMPPIPCHQGMTLEPGQSCVATVHLPTRVEP